MSERRERGKQQPKAPPPPAAVPWTTDTWGRNRRFAGYPRYQCTHCPVDSLDEGQIREHVQQAHGLLLDDNTTPGE